MASSFDDNQNNTIPAYATSEANDARVAMADYGSQKETELNDAAQRNLERLKRITTATEFRNSWTGTILQAGTANNLPLSIAGGAVRGTGAAVAGAGKAFGNDAAINVGETIKDAGDTVLGGRNVSLQERIERTSPTGDITKPSTWGVEDFDLAGFSHLIAQTTGEMAPIIAAAAIPYAGLALGPAIGAAQSFDEAYDSQKDLYKDMDMFDLSNQDAFRDLIKQGYTYEQARDALGEQAGMAAGTASAAVGAIGTDRLLSILRKGVIKKTATEGIPEGATLKGMAAEFGGNVLKGSVVEGVEEVAQTVLGRLAASAATGEDQDLTEDTLADAILGAAAGGATIAQQAITLPAAAATIGATKGIIGGAKLLKKGVSAAANASLDGLNEFQEGMAQARAERQANQPQGGEGVDEPSVDMNSPEQQAATAQREKNFADKTQEEIQAELSSILTPEQISEFGDLSKDTYNPVRVAREAEKALRAGKLTQEGYEKYIETTQEVLDGEIISAGYIAETDEALVAEQVAKAKEDLVKIQQKLDAKEGNQAILEIHRERREAIINATPEMRVKAAERLKQLEAHRDRLSLYTPTKGDTAATLASVDKELSRLEQESEVDGKVNAEDLSRVITRFAAVNQNKGKVLTRKAVQKYKDKIVSLMDKAELTEAQRTEYLQVFRNLDEKEKDSGRKRANTIDDVHNDSIYGNTERGQVGVIQMVKQALKEIGMSTNETSNREKVKKTAERIKNFKATLQDKLDKLDEAIIASRKAGSARMYMMPRVSPNKFGVEWEIGNFDNQSDFSEADVRAAGGLLVTPKTKVIRDALADTIDSVDVIQKEFVKYRRVHSRYSNANSKAEEAAMELAGDDLDAKEASDQADRDRRAKDSAKNREKPVNKPAEPEKAKTKAEILADKAAQELKQQKEQANEEGGDIFAQTAEDIKSRKTDKVVSQDKESRRARRLAEVQRKQDIADGKTVPDDGTRMSKASSMETVQENTETTQPNFENENLVTNYMYVKSAIEVKGDSIDPETGEQIFSVVSRPLSEDNAVTTYISGHTNAALTLTLSKLNDAPVDEAFNLIADMNDAIEENIPEEHSALPWDDMLRYFINGDGDVNENVLTAMSVAILETQRVLGKKSLFNSKRDIARYMGIDEDQVTPELYSLLYEGIPRDYLIDTLGGIAVRYLGLAYTADTPLNIPENVRTSLGMHALNAMHTQDMYLRKDVEGLNNIKKRIMQDTDEAIGETENDTSVYYVVNMTPGATIETDNYHSEAGYNTAILFEKDPKIVEKIFGDSGIENLPTTEQPKSWKQTKINNSERSVPKVFEERALASSQRAYTPRDSTVFGAFKRLSTKFQEVVAGFEDSDGHTATSKARIQSRNLSYRVDIDNLFTYFGSSAISTIKKFYLKPAMWSIQRAGYLSNFINPLSSKLQRVMISQESWKSNISLDETAADNVIFRLFLADAFGLQADTKTPDNTLAALEEKVATEEFQAALKVMNSILDSAEDSTYVDYGTTEDVALEAFKKVVDGPEAFDALVTYALYKKAQETGGENGRFITDFAGSVDGVTNGVALSVILLGSTQSHGDTKQGTTPDLTEMLERMERTGFFGTDSEHDNVAEFKEAKNADNYEVFVGGLLDGLEKSLQPSLEFDEAGEIIPESDLQANERALKISINGALSYFVGELRGEDNAITFAGRNLVKIPVTATSFGASLNTLINGISEDVLLAIEKRYAEVSKDTESDAYAEFLDNFDILMNTQLDERTGEIDRADFNAAWKRSDIANLRASMGELFTSSASSAIQATFGNFTNLRDGVTSIHNVSYEIFHAVYMNLRQQFFDEELAKNRIPTGRNAAGKLIPIGDLSTNQLRRFEALIKPIIPIVGTAMSTQSENDIDAGLSMFKTQMVRASNEFAILYGQKAQVIGEGGKQQEVANTGRIKDIASPGVAGFIGQIHSLESSIISEVYGKFAVASHHDAIYGGVNMLMEAGQDINRAAYHNLANYSLTVETLRGFVRMLKGLDSLSKKMPNLLNKLGDRKGTDGAKPFHEIIGKIVAGIVTKEDYDRHPDKNNLSLWYANMITKAIRSERVKLEALLQQRMVSQYNMPGAEYTLKPADKAMVQKKLDELGKMENELKDSLGLVQEIGDVIDKGGKEFVLAKQKEVIASMPAETAVTLAREIEQANTNRPRVIMNMQAIVREILHGKSLAEALTVVSNLAERATIENMFITKNPITDVIVDGSGLRMNNKRIKKLLETIIKNAPNQNNGQLFTAQDVANAKAILNLVKAGSTLDQAIAKRFDAKQNSNQGMYEEEFRELLRKSVAYLRPSPWGRLGNPVIPADLTLDNFMKKEAGSYKGASMETVLNYLVKRVSGNRSMNARIASVMSKHLLKIAPDVRIHYIGVNSDIIPEGLIKYEDEYHAVYHTENGVPAIYIKGAAFEQSNMNAEIILHEIIHAAVIPKMDAVRRKLADGYKYSELTQAEKNIADVLDRLDDIYMEVGKALGTDRAKYGDVFPSNFDENTLPSNQNIDEFLAWGLTDARLQRQMNKIPMPEDMRKKFSLSGSVKNLYSALVTGIASLLGLAVHNNSALEMFLNTSLMALDETTLSSIDESYDASVRFASANTGANPSVDNEWTTLEIFDSLNSKTDPVESNRLKQMLMNFTIQIEGAIRAAGLEGDKDAYVNPEDVYINALMTNAIPFTSDIRKAMQLDEQQSYVLEALEASFYGAMDSTTLAYRELSRLFEEAKGKVTAASLLADPDNANSFEIKQAKELLDILFNPSKGENPSRYLSRFLAAAAVLPNLRAAMDYQSTTTKKVSKKKGILAKIDAMTLKTLDMASDNFMKMDKLDRKASDRLGQVAATIATVNGKRRVQRTLQDESNYTKVVETLSFAVNKLSRAVSKAADKLGKHKWPVVAVVGNLTKATIDGELQRLGDTIQSVRNKMFDDVHGFVGATLSEMKGEDDINTGAVQRFNLAKQFEREVSDFIKDTRKFILAGFQNNGADLTPQQRVVMTKVAMKSGLGTLVDTYSENQLMDFLTDKSKVDAEIQNLRKAILAEHPAAAAKEIIVNTANTGYFFATGKVKSIKVFHNATQIAIDAVDSFDVGLNEQIDALISLEALSYTDPKLITQMGEIVATERARTDDGNGVYTFLKSHKLFIDTVESSNVKMTGKGFYSPSTNANNDVVTVRESEADTYEKLGYVIKHTMKADPLDPNGEAMVVLVGEGAGAQRRVSGIVNFANPYFNTEGYTTTGSYESSIEDNRSKARDARHKKVIGFVKDPSNYKVDVNGADYAFNGSTYIMDHDARETVYEQNMQMEDVLSGMFGSQIVRQNAMDHNIEAFEELAKLGKNKSFHAEDMLELSPNSKHKEVREAYALLPQHTKNYIKDVYGDAPVRVPRELFRTFFGYETKSLFREFALSPQTRGPIAESVMGVLQQLLGKDAGLKLMRAERFWESAVALFKDVIIIRNLFTFVQNSMSNVTILASFGLNNPKTLARLHKEGSLGIIRYQQDMSELNQLVMAKRLGQNIPDIDNKITALLAAMEANPVAPLVAAGMQQSIVEDVDADAGQYIRQSKLGKKVQSKLDGLPKGVVTFGKEALVLKGSTIHNWLYKGTAMSDFVARYALYKHLSELSGNKNLDSAMALRVADAAFINYDLMSHPNMDKMNKLGIVNFTRFTLRIQKTILAIWRNHPVEALATAVGSALFGVESISESILPNRKIMYMGAFELPGTINDIITIKAAGDILGM